MIERFRLRAACNAAQTYSMRWRSASLCIPQCSAKAARTRDAEIQSQKKNECRKKKTAGLAPGGLFEKSLDCLARRAAGAGIPLRIGIERRLHHKAAEDRNDAVADHHEH